LSLAERTGCRLFFSLWPYMLEDGTIYNILQLKMG